MKKVFFILPITVILFTACNSGNNGSAGNDGTQTKDSAPAKADADSTATKIVTTPSGVDAKVSASMKEVVISYLQIKNGLAGDDGNEAASGGNALVGALGKFDKSSLTPEQKKAYEDVADDARENAEHIGKSGGKIAHQREHFDMLSKDLYELVKTFGGGQPLYLDNCPMYNNGKGADWISEIKEIKNPYLGKEMPTCGSVKLEFK
jgi:hypothetical protein